MASSRKTTSPSLLDDYDPDWIKIRGARSNNLKAVDLDLPRNRLIVVTGVSGSGKSSITIDTLYAEGQRRYVESLSAYARQFLMRMKKPEVDSISGIAPAIAISQKSGGGNNRSTVGTLTEIYDFLRLLYARIGKTYSPVSGQQVRKHEVSDVVDHLRKMPEGGNASLCIPLPVKYTERTIGQELQLLLQKGYTRILEQGKPVQIEDWLGEHPTRRDQKLGQFPDIADIRILIDRFVIKQEDEDNWKRIADSVLTAFQESEGECIILAQDGAETSFNNRFELDGIVFPELNPQLFNFNNSFGACPQCEGYGKVIGIDEDKVIPDTSLSIYGGAIACWRGESGGEWLAAMIAMSKEFNLSIHKPWYELSPAEKHLVWYGKPGVGGIYDYFKSLEEKTYKIQNRVILARYRGKTNCPECNGRRLRKEAGYVRIDGKTIQELVERPLVELKVFFTGIHLSAHDRQIASRLIYEVTSRLGFMVDVGLGYLTLNRVANTLSGGETQRINLTRILGSNLTSALYILDEPSIGLHPRDTARLITVLKRLRDMGNTVIVVEHEEEIMRACDFLVDMGPLAGVHGGEVVYAGPFDKIFRSAPTSLTTGYLTGTQSVSLPGGRRRIASKITVSGARLNNLKNLTVSFPLQTLTVVTGVSGSGKSTLVQQILHPMLEQTIQSFTSGSKPTLQELSGDVRSIHAVEMISQSPLGRSSRSNPVTYVKAYDAIRELMSRQPLSMIRDYKPRHFSFNVEGGRCETCKGDGEIVVEMQFLADVRLECDDCKGKRFKQEMLEVYYKEKNIADILTMTIEEAIDFFGDHDDIIQRIQPLHDVGLGYVQLGQSSSTLSGGEAQRVKLASFLAKDHGHTPMFFIFDEPTTGLHFHDIGKLVTALQALVDHGHTVLVVEHNVEVIKCADWVIELGPEAGDEGGNIVFEGRPEDMVHCEISHTAPFLKPKMVVAM